MGEDFFSCTIRFSKIDFSDREINVRRFLVVNNLNDTAGIPTPSAPFFLVDPTTAEAEGGSPPASPRTDGQQLAGHAETTPTDLWAHDMIFDAIERDDRDRVLLLALKREDKVLPPAVDEVLLHGVDDQLLEALAEAQ